MTWHLSPVGAAARLSTDAPCAELFRHGSPCVDLSAPIGDDRQKPYTRGEVGVFSHHSEGGERA